MKNLAHRHGEVAFGFKVLWQGGVVSRLDSPIGVEVIDPGGVWPATGQHGRPTGRTHSLLSRGGVKKKREGKNSLNISKPCDPNRTGIELKKAPEILECQTCAYALRKTWLLEASWSMFGDLTTGSP